MVSCDQRGGLPAWSPACPSFSFVFAPYPPTPLPRRGRGSFFVYFAGGFAPGTPALNRLRHLQPLLIRFQAGGVPPALPARRALAVPCGSLPSLSPAYPAFSLLSFPHPPYPLPGGKGEIITLFRRGIRPRHPCIKPFAALARPAPGERTISNAEVPLPRSPLSLAAGTAPRKQTEPFGRASAAPRPALGMQGAKPLA